MKKCSNRKLTMVKIIMKKIACAFYFFVYLHGTKYQSMAGEIQTCDRKIRSKKYDLGYRRRWGGNVRKDRSYIYRRTYERRS